MFNLNRYPAIFFTFSKLFKISQTIVFVYIKFYGKIIDFCLFIYWGCRRGGIHERSYSGQADIGQEEARKEGGRN